jgi:hypothetical protein
MNYRPEITESLKTALTDAELYRKEKYALYQKNKFVSISLGLLSGLTFLIFLGLGLPFLIILPIVGVILTFYHFNKYTNVHWLEFQKKYKTTILKKVIESLYPGIEYQSEKHISSTNFNSSGLFSTGYTSFKGEDYFSGMIETTSYEMSELNVIRRSSSYSNGKNTTKTTTIFKGLFVVLDFKSSTYGETYIFQDVSEKFLGGVGRFLQKNIGSFFQKGSMIYFENHPEFEKDFVVYSTEEQESRRLLTPGLIQTIGELKYKLGVTPYLSFIQDKAYIAFTQNKDFLKVRFDLDLIEKQHEIIQSIIEEVALCMNLVTEINTETIRTINSSPSTPSYRKPNDNS